MNCPHCAIDFHESWSANFLYRGQGSAIGSDGSGFWAYRTTQCSRCKDYAIEIARTDNNQSPLEDWRQVYPIGANRGY